MSLMDTRTCACAHTTHTHTVTYKHCTHIYYGTLYSLEKEGNHAIYIDTNRFTGYYI